jgi:hypothetical protein
MMVGTVKLTGLIVCLLLSFLSTTVASEEGEFIAREPYASALKEHLPRKSMNGRLKPAGKLTGRTDGPYPVDISLEENVEESANETVMEDNPAIPTGKVELPIIIDRGTENFNQQYNTTRYDNTTQNYNMTQNDSTTVKYTTIEAKTSFPFSEVTSDATATIEIAEEKRLNGLWITIGVLAVIILILLIVWLLLKLIKEKKLQRIKSFKAVPVATPGTQLVVIVDGTSPSTPLPRDAEKMIPAPAPLPPFMNALTPDTSNSSTTNAAQP